jgi:hypothetical protein
VQGDDASAVETRVVQLLGLDHSDLATVPVLNACLFACAASLCSCVQGDDASAVETRVVQLLGLDHFDLAKDLLRNRLKIVWVSKLRQAQDETEVGLTAHASDAAEVSMNDASCVWPCRQCVALVRVNKACGHLRLCVGVQG